MPEKIGAKKKAPNKKPIQLPTFDLNGFKSDMGLADEKVKDKELAWISLGDEFYQVTGLPGIPKGFLTLFRGFSNTGKSTAVYAGAVGCQKLGILPVIIDTENNWSWDHAKEIGLEFEEVCDEETGEIINYRGFFIYVNNDTLLNHMGTYDYAEAKDKKERRTEAVIEDVAAYIDELLASQANGKLPVELCIFWDSVGSVDCFRGVTSKSKNNMWNAGALESSFKAILNHKIPGSRKEGKPFTNTFVGVQKIWLDSMQGAGVIKHKGGEAFFYAARLIIHMGGIQSHGTTQINAKSGPRNYYYATESNIKIAKNQVNGVTWEGKILSTAHGFIASENKADYIDKYRKFFLEKLELGDNDKIELVEKASSDEDIRDMYVS